MTNESATALAEIAVRLDGLPLAIELAAAKTRILSPAAILARLGSRLAFLSGGPRDVPARQQTLREAIDWSYGLLATAEQSLFRRAGVFVGGWSIDAADEVCSTDALGLDALGALSSLVDQSLVRIHDVADVEPRFIMLETIREFAVDKLVNGAELDEMRERHARHYRTVAGAMEPELTRSPDAVNRIGVDHDNFRAALGWAIERGDAELGLTLGFALWRFWHQRAFLREGREWFERLLALPGSAAPTLARAKGLTGAAGIAYWQNDYAIAEAWYAEAESIFRSLGDRASLADAIYNTASMAMIRGNASSAAAKLQEGAILARSLNNDELLGKFVAAEGYLAFMADDFETARTLLEESLQVALRSGDRFATAGAHHTVGQVARLQGRLSDAAEQYRLALRILQEFGDEASLTEPMQGLAAVAISSGETERGVRLLGANAAIRERIGGGPPPEWLRLGDPLARARGELSEEAYQAAWEAGMDMSADDAVADALGD